MDLKVGRDITVLVIKSSLKKWENYVKPIPR